MRPARNSKSSVSSPEHCQGMASRHHRHHLGAQKGHKHKIFLDIHTLLGFIIEVFTWFWGGNHHHHRHYHHHYRGHHQQKTHTATSLPSSSAAAAAAFSSPHRSPTPVVITTRAEMLVCTRLSVHPIQAHSMPSAGTVMEWKHTPTTIETNMPRL